MFRVRFTSLAPHIAGWLLFMSLPILFMYREGSSNNILSLLLSAYYWQFCFCYFALFYLNSNLLFPKLYLPGRKVLYALAVVLLLVVIQYIKPFGELLHEVQGREGMPHPGFFPRPHPPFDGPPPPGPMGPGARPGPPIDITSLFLSLLVIALSFTNRTLREWQESNKRILQAETDKARAELSFLKAQIHPHFLFNILNNLYSLAIIKHESTADAILRLSKIMRYMIDEANKEWVPLSGEAAFLEDYISLQRLRISRNMNVDFSIHGDVENKKIAPLLLVNFVENAFKFGSSSHYPAAITIRIESTSDSIRFFCRNSIFKKHSADGTGTGISNTRKRLAHVYAGKYILDIQHTEELFVVDLTLYTF